MEKHEWEDGGTDCLGDKDFKCEKCKVYASTLLPESIASKSCKGKNAKTSD